MSPDVFLQHLVNGISLGFIFGLIAIGYTLVYEWSSL
jgi:branched-chain amino acid transport system permease protein